MLIQSPASPELRDFRTERIETDLCIVGGGMAGTCAAITAARAGAKVTIIQDRPVLGGNASSEIRLWVLGATAHMGNNNRWAREGGVLDEILVENLHRNREGNPVILDTILLEKVVEEPNITLLLNTAAYEVEKAGDDAIQSVRAFNSQNQTVYEVRAPLFCDASGDGVIAYLAGASFRMGAEDADEFDEKFAPDEEYGALLGHSMYFYSKDTGEPVRFVPPSYALKDITEISRWGRFNPQRSHGCFLWWLEWGGRLDTVHDTEAIKWELWKVVFGVWDHIKNSGRFPEAETMTLEWATLIPGKRESRRFEGPYMMHQRDIIEQRTHDDDVAFGGWSIDLHPANGVYDTKTKSGCDQWHARGVYNIPYRCLYSKDIHNLFLAGRIFSASHVAFGSTRVMATLAGAAQAVGMAAAICTRDGLNPGDLVDSGRVEELQRDLMRVGHHIPGLKLQDPDDLAQDAEIEATSRLRLAALPPDGPARTLETSSAMLLPVNAGKAPNVTFTVDVAQPTTLTLQLRQAERPENFTPGVILASQEIALEAGEGQQVTAQFDVTLDAPRYVFYCLMQNDHVAVRCSEQRLTGVLSVFYRRTQRPDRDIGVETFEMWTPERRPGGHNFAMTIDPPLDVYAPANAANGIARPTGCGPNAWIADFEDSAPALTLRWKEPQKIARLVLGFDTDFDHPLESAQWGHPEHELPFCVKHYRILDGAGRVVAEVAHNHQTQHAHTFDPPIETDALTVEVVASHGETPAALFEVRAYAANRQP